MNTIYKFYLRLGSGATPQKVHPVWKDDMSLDYQRENGEMFMRRQLSASLDFIGKDYTLITGADFDTEFFLDIHSSVNNGTSWTQYYTGRFMITDCMVNADDQKVTVKPQVWDRYNAILAGMEKEFDLIKLAPAIQPVTVIRRPVIQVYVEGETKVTNVLSGMSWEQDAEETTDYDRMTEDYHFGFMGARQEIVFQNAPSGLGGTFIGSFDHWNQEGEWHDFDNGQGVYYISTYQHVTVEPGATAEWMKALRIYRYSDNALIWEWKAWDPTQFPEVPTPCTFSAIAEGFSDVTMTWVGTRVYGRIVMATDTYAGAEVFEIPAEDITATNRNFRYCTPYGFDGSVVMSSAHQSEPTEWGMRPDGTYYTKPDPTLDSQGYIPVGRSMWLYASLWFVQSSVSETLEQRGRKDTPINDSFTLEAVITALLKEIAPTVTFAATSAYSVFLYGTNPLAASWGRLMMTPKSNILVAEYTQPARKAPVTLRQVLDMLRTACGCYWFIDGSNRLRIEHISFFKNGGSYNGSPTVGIDLTQMKNSRSGKSWSMGTTTFSWDKMDMAQRYQYGWMDDSTNVFAGFPIDVISKYVTEGRIEEETVEAFNADIDYLMLNPTNVSQDGFALLCCTYSSGRWRTQIASGLTYNGGRYTLQNWQLAFAQLQPTFLISDMPAWDIKVNGAQTRAMDIQRKKRQTVNIPLEATDPDTDNLVRTGVGDGYVENMQVRLTSRMAQMQLSFRTKEGTPGPGPGPGPQPETDPALFTEIFTQMRVTVNNRLSNAITATGAVHDYLLAMYRFADANMSIYYDSNVFALALPQSGTLISDADRAKKVQMAWLMAMCLGEICTAQAVASDIYDTAYSIVGSTNSQRVFGYQLASDANIARLVASVLWAIRRPVLASMLSSALSEVRAKDTGNVLGTVRGTTIPTDYTGQTTACPEGVKFMPSTPKNGSTNADFAFDESTWNYIFANYKYVNGAYNNQRAQQAVEDSTRTTVAAQRQMYIDAGVNVTSAQEALVTPCYMWGSRISAPMKDGYNSVTQSYYPGYTDSPRTDAEFRQRPFAFHSEHLLDPNDDGSTYVNSSSYPSGHAGFGWNIALILMETHRNSVTDVKAIMKRAFEFGQSRVIGRYHWQADVIHGCVIGSACIPRLHAYNEYQTLLNNA